MRAVELCDAKLYDAYFARNSGAEIMMGPENGITYGAYCTQRVGETGTNAQIEAAIDTQTLAGACEDPAVSALLGASMIFAVAEYEDVFGYTDRSDLRYCYPNVEKLCERIGIIQARVPDFQPPEIRRFDGEIFHADRQMEALVDGAVLVSEHDGHDMKLHIPVWLFMRKGSDIFQQLQRSAEDSLRNPGESDGAGRYASNILTDGIELTIALSPLMGELMCNPFFQDRPNSAQMKFLTTLMGSLEAARSALFEFGGYAREIGSIVLGYNRSGDYFM